MRGSRIQAIVRELNNEKIDIVNYSEQSEILISRALSPAKPLDLYIDDDRKYCIAIFDDDDLELAIGRGGVNVNLASTVTEYRIDAFGKNEYENKQIEQETLLSDIKNMPKRPIKPLEENNIKTVSDLLNTEEDKIVEIKGITETSLEKVYDAVQKFVEENQSQKINKDETIDKVEESSLDKESNIELEKVES
jgi:N utilization substance protein A